MTRARDLANLIGSGNFTTETLTATAGQTAFTPSNTFTSNFLQVFYNGLLLDPTVDYTENGTTITLTVPATAGDEMEVVTYNTFSVGDAITQTEADNRYVNAVGDTMTGDLVLDKQTATSQNAVLNSIKFRNGYASPDYVASIDAYKATYDNNIGFKFNVQVGGPNGSPVSLEALQIDQNGWVRMPYQVAFHAYKSGGGVNYGYAAGDIVSANMDATRFNMGGGYNTANGKFTAPISGYYMTGINLFNNSSADHRRIRILVNGGSQVPIGQGQAAAGGQFNGIGLLYLSAGDYMELVSAYSDTYVFQEINHSNWWARLIG